MQPASSSLKLIPHVSPSERRRVLLVMNVLPSLDCKEENQ